MEAEKLFEEEEEGEFSGVGNEIIERTEEENSKQSSAIFKVSEELVEETRRKGPLLEERRARIPINNDPIVLSMSS